MLLNPSLTLCFTHTRRLTDATVDPPNLGLPLHPSCKCVTCRRRPLPVALGQTGRHHLQDLWLVSSHNSIGLRVPPTLPSCSNLAASCGHFRGQHWLGATLTDKFYGETSAQFFQTAVILGSRGISSTLLRGAKSVRVAPGI